MINWFLGKGNVPEFLSGLTEWLISNGGWLFPLILLISHFSLRNYVLKRPTGIDVYRSFVTIPIEIKMISCSFIFAAAMTQKQYTLALFVIALVYIFLLAVSVGFYNYVYAETISEINKMNGAYLIAFTPISILMLNFSIQLMKFGGVK